jgi:hypothetical protein
MLEDEIIDEVAGGKNPYRDALFTAWRQMTELKEEEKRLIIKKAQLKQTSDALWPLAFPDEAGAHPDINSMTLADAIRLLVKSCNGRPTNIKEIRNRLQDVGYDLSKYKNPLASIHTAANRMVESEELSWYDEDRNRLTEGENMKPVLTSEQPNPETPAAIDAVRQALESKEK